MIIVGAAVVCLQSVIFILLRAARRAMAVAVGFYRYIQNPVSCVKPRGLLSSKWGFPAVVVAASCALFS